MIFRERSPYPRANLLGDLEKYFLTQQQTDRVKIALRQVKERRLEGAKVLLEEKVAQGSGENQTKDREAERLLKEIKQILE